jgi:two-component sensor histidine kinase
MLFFLFICLVVKINYMSLIGIWNNLSSNGLKPEMGFNEVKRIRIVNQFAVVGIYIALSYTVFLLCLSEPILALLDFAIVIFGLIVYILVKKTNYRIAAVFMFLSIPMPLIAINLFYGQGGAEFYFFSLFILCYYIFPQPRFLFPLLAYLIISFTLARNMGNIAKPSEMAEILAVYFFYINIVCSFIIGSMFLRLFTREHINYQKEVEEKNMQLAIALQETNEKNERIQILLKELSHRTKNNLQLISSLINIQSSKITDVSAKKALDESRNRIISIALIHKKLYQSNQMVSVSFKEYVADLITYLVDTFEDKINPFRIEQDIDNFAINVDSAVTLGLLLNELLTNSFKHGMKNSDDKFIKILIKRKGKDGLDLIISDSGTGIENIAEADNSSSFGTKLIHSLIKQMKGNLIIEDKNENKLRINLIE